MNIKVIKKKDFGIVNDIASKAGRDERREIAVTVSGWVADSQKVRGEEQKRTFEQLFTPLLPIVQQP